MDLPKLKALIDLVGRSNIAELDVAKNDVTVRICRASSGNDVFPASAPQERSDRADARESGNTGGTIVRAPVFGILYSSAASGEAPFVSLGDRVEGGQTLFVIESMKVLNKVPAPHAGRIVRLSAIEGTEVQSGDVLAEIAG